MSIYAQNKSKYIDYISRHLTKKRFAHSLGTTETAIELAERFGEDAEKAEVAAILHDAGKYYPDKLKWAKENGITDEIMLSSPEMLHGYISASIAEKEFQITDADILNAIKYHTTGREKMSTLEKIIYLADLIEPNRTLGGLEPIREAAKNDLDEAFLLAVEYVIAYVLKKKETIHIDSIKAYNKLIQDRRFK